MKALSKEQEAKRRALGIQLAQENEKFTAFIEEANVIIHEKVNGQVITVNNILAEMRELHEEITDAQQEYYDDKSEKWHDSDAGEAYADWMSEWKSAPPPDEIEEYELLEPPADVDEAPDEFENLPSGVDS